MEDLEVETTVMVVDTEEIIAEVKTVEEETEEDTNFLFYKLPDENSIMYF